MSHVAAPRRAREMAIRMALGATGGDVVRLVILSGARAPLIGMGVGVALALVLAIGASKVVTGALRISGP